VNKRKPAVWPQTDLKTQNDSHLKDIAPLSPNTWRTAYEKGRGCLKKGNLTEALAAFNKAIELNAKAAEAFHDRGVALQLSGNFTAAFDAFKRAVALTPTLDQAWFNGGCMLCAMQQPRKAIAWFKQALELNPYSAHTHYNLANAYKAVGKIKDSVDAYRRCLRLDPEMPEAHNNLGTVLMSVGELEQAGKCVQRAIDLKGDYVQALYNWGLVLSRQQRVDDAIEMANRCLSVDPKYGDALALLVSVLQQSCEWYTLDDANTKLDCLTAKQLQAGTRPSESPFLAFTRGDDAKRNFTIARAWGQWAALKYGARQLQLEFDCSRQEKDHTQLNIGYLSERFRDAATGHLMAGLFSLHDRRKFNISAYSWGKDDGSYYRRKIEQGVDQFVDIGGLSDEDAALKIKQDRIDILVDLMGWMHGNRIGILARKPAPVQTGYLGYPGTTGAPFIDFIIADRVVIPEAHRQFFSEKVIWLPNCYQVTDPASPFDERATSRKAHGLPEDAMVLCCFSTDYKIERRVFAAWMQVLKAHGASVLWLLVRSETAKENLRRQAESFGIASHRLVFADPLPKKKHLSRLTLADLALDTMTVNGHTTITDALLADIPVITCQGNHFASRVGSSILRSVGLGKLVTHSVDEYANLIKTLAQDKARLKSLKEMLVKNKAVYPLFDTQRFVRDLETVFLQMWRCYRSDTPMWSCK
jgi:protein O-GlcNAc transferase